MSVSMDTGFGRNKNYAPENVFDYIPMLLQLGSTSLENVYVAINNKMHWQHDESLQDFMNSVSRIIKTVPWNLRQESDVHDTSRRFVFSHLKHFQKRLDKQKQNPPTEEYDLVVDLLRIYKGEKSLQKKSENTFKQKIDVLKQREIQYKDKIKELNQQLHNSMDIKIRLQNEKTQLVQNYEEEFEKLHTKYRESLEQQKAGLIAHFQGLHQREMNQVNASHKKTLDEAKENHQKDIQSCKTTLEDYTEQIEHLKKELSEHQNKEQEYLDRLSLMMMSQEIGRSDANENLMDKYRPSVIKNQFRNLFVNEYGEVDADLENQIPDMKTRSKLLMNILFGAFGICGNFVENQKKIVKDKLANVFTNHPFDKDKNVQISNHMHDTICNRLKESPDTQIFKEIKQDLFRQLNDKFPGLLDKQNESQMKSLSEYVNHCVEVTWRMKCCNPPLYITMETMVFDKRCHQKFDGDGQYIGYYLWPTLYSSEDHFKNNRPPYEKAEVVRTASPHIDPINPTSEPSKVSSQAIQTCTTPSIAQTASTTPTTSNNLTVSAAQTTTTTGTTSTAQTLPTVRTTSTNQVDSVQPPSSLQSETGFALIETKSLIRPDEDQDDDFHDKDNPEQPLTKPLGQKVGILAEQEREKKKVPVKIIVKTTTKTKTTRRQFANNDLYYRLGNSGGDGLPPVDNSGNGGSTRGSSGLFPGYSTRVGIESGYQSGVSNLGFTDNPKPRQ